MIWTILFIVFVGGVLPYVSWTSYRHLSKEIPQDELPSSRALAVQALIVHGIVFALAFACFKANQLDISGYSEVDFFTGLVALVVLVAALFVAIVQARRALGPKDALRKKLREQGITALGLVTMVTAAVIEEFAYRGVLYMLMDQVMSGILAAVISAVLFGLSHFSQGSQGAIIGVCFALAMQYLCILSGALFLAVVVHFLYDLGVSLLGKYFAPRLPKFVNE